MSVLVIRLTVTLLSLQSLTDPSFLITYSLPVCKVFTHDIDGFCGGKAIIKAADAGNGFRVFNGTIKVVFAFGFVGRPELNQDCFLYTEYLISCYLYQEIGVDNAH